MQPLIPQLQREARNEQEFNQKLEQLQDSVIQNLIDRVLIIKEFQQGRQEAHPRSASSTTGSPSILSDQFDNDRSKFLAYLRSRGRRCSDYRKEVEEDIIYHYMQQQQRKSQSIVSPVRIEQFYKENKDQFYQEDSVHLRLIQLTRAERRDRRRTAGQGRGDPPALQAGEKFEDLAKEYSEDTTPHQGRRLGLAEAHRPQAGVQRAALCPQEGRGHRARSSTRTAASCFTSRTASTPASSRSTRCATRSSAS